ERRRGRPAPSIAGGHWRCRVQIIVVVAAHNRRQTLLIYAGRGQRPLGQRRRSQKGRRNRQSHEKSTRKSGHCPPEAGIGSRRQAAPSLLRDEGTFKTTIRLSRMPSSA